MTRTSRGLTLVEMLVVLALLGVIAGVAAVALPPVRAPVIPSTLEAIATARRAAILKGQPMTITFSQDSVAARLVTAWPDGRVVTDSVAAVDLFTGRLHAAR